ncbi:MAG: sigma 54-interacting transcriptional regulator [Sandaracinaceae bacterium]
MSRQPSDHLASAAAEPFGDVIEEALGALPRRGMRLVLLDGPPRVGLDWILEQAASRWTGPVLRGRARPGVPYSALEDVVVGAVERWREAGLRPTLPERPLRCLRGCHRFWFEHQADAALDPLPWERAAEGRVSFFEAVRQLVSGLSAHDRPPLIVLEDLAHLDPGSADLLGYVLGEDGLSATTSIGPGALWSAGLPPPSERAADLARLTRFEASRFLTVPPLGPAEVAAYLARPEVARAVWARTGGLLEEVEQLLTAEPADAVAAADHAPAPVPLRVVPRSRLDPEEALREADGLLARHALAEAAAVLEEARSTGEPPELRAQLAELRWLLGDHAEAVELARRPLAADPESPSAHLRLGRLLRRAGQHEEAAEHLVRVRALAELVGDGERGLRADQELAELALEQARYDDARALADGVAARAEEAGLAELGLEARNTVGKVAWREHRLDEAEAIFADIRERGERAGLYGPLHAALNNLGLVALGRDDLRSARRSLTRAAELADQQGAVVHRAIALENLGIIDRLEGRYEAAIGHYQAAGRLMRPLGHRRMLARLAGNLAELFTALGSPARALSVLTVADRMDRTALRPTVLAEHLLFKAEALDLAGQAGAAKSTYEEAYEVAVDIGYRGRATLSALERADLARREGQVEDAEAWMDRAGDLAEPRFQLRRWMLAARLAPTPEAAVHASRRGLGAARRGVDRLLETEAVVLHAGCLERLGMLDDAARHVERAARLETESVQEVPEELREAFRLRRVASELARLQRTLGGRQARSDRRPGPRPLRRLVGSSKAMGAVRAWIERVAPVDATLLITGDSGTGKELVAEAVHGLSSRAAAPFIRVNCGAFVDSLLLSELFGHERGAFTGADRQRLGHFERADGGTLFLDEIGELSAATQSALLRVLQQGTFQRVGGTRTLRVDVRVIAATNRDLEAMVDQGSFRADLFYRLAGLHLRLPPLRARLADLPELATVLLERIRRENGIEGTVRLTRDALDRLEAHGWPGNVRELENVLRSAVLLSGRTELRAEDLAGFAPSAARWSAPPTAEAATSLEDLFFDAVGDRGSIYQLRKHLERETIARALTQTSGNIAEAARLLGMTRPRVSQLVKAYALKDDPRVVPGDDDA